jgi:hypothetical protein
MPCTPTPKPSIPDPPAGLTLSPPDVQLPKPNVPDPCCQLPKLPGLPSPQPFPPGFVNPGLVATLRAGLQAVEDWIDSLPLECPRQ